VHLRRERDRIDRDDAEPLDVPAMARTVHMTPVHFSRKFRAVYGEPPYTYLMTRRIERAKALLRQGISVTDACMAVGCTSLGSFSSATRRATWCAPRRPDRPEGGSLGCRIVFTGSPADLVAAHATLTGKHLAAYVNAAP
jgi:AraC-like DNA-binding protein